jgi:hypothetical protein
MEFDYVRASGLVALATTLLALTAPGDTRMLRLLTLSAVLWSLNNFLLGAFTACALSLLSAARTTVSLTLKDRGLHMRLPACLGFCAGAGVVTALTWCGAVSLLPMAGALASTTGNFFLTGVPLRLALGASNLLWLASALHFRAWEQVASLAASLLATAYGAWRVHQSAVSPLCERQRQPTL